MTPLEILKAVKGLESNDIYELYRNRGIEIVHKPELFVHSRCEARIISDIFGRTTVFLRMRPGEKPLFEKFILWHELGHVIVKGPPAKRSEAFTAGIISSPDELEPNIFAVLALFRLSKGIQNLYQLSDHQGIPMDVLHSVVGTLNSDPEFMEYLDSK